MKVAFASCIDATEDDTQAVWVEILDNHRPDLLLLLGDSIYMDYWPHLGRPKTYSDEKFAKDMHDRYRRQWAVASFRTLVRSVKQVGITWDDHDFAWNGACGLATTKRCTWNADSMSWECEDTGVPQPYPDIVPDTKKRISHALFRQFREVLRHGRMQDTYPTMPALNDMLGQPVKGIQECFDLGDARIIMLDGRTFREPLLDAAPGLMLGTAQQRWLRDKVREWAGVKIICSGSTLARAGESWDKYRDLAWLMRQGFERTLVLSGDIHRNAAKDHDYKGYILREYTSSGAARPGLGGGSGNFGILKTLPDGGKAYLYKVNGQMEISATFDW